MTGRTKNLLIYKIIKFISMTITWDKRNKRTLQFLTYKRGRPVQFDGSNTFNKHGMPSVGMAPGSNWIDNK